MQKAVDMRENDPRSCWYIVQCLKRQFEEDEDLEKLRAGIHYANLIIEYGYASQGFVEKGHFYVLMGSYESARQNSRGRSKGSGKSLCLQQSFEDAAADRIF